MTTIPDSEQTKPIDSNRSKLVFEDSVGKEENLRFDKKLTLGKVSNSHQVNRPVFRSRTNDNRLNSKIFRGSHGSNAMQNYLNSD